MKYIRKAPLILLLGCLLIWAAAIIRCEFLTLQLSDKDIIIRAIKNCIHTEDDINVKVLNKSTDSLELYCRQKDGGKYVAGHVFTVAIDESKSEKYTVSLWDVIWVARGYGNASELIWPYLLDGIIYGG